MQPTTEEVRGTPPPFGWILAATVIVLNSVALALAWNDKGSGAFWIAVVAGPILNACLALVATVTTFLLKLRYPQFSIVLHLLLSLGLPAAAIFLDGWIIISMDLYGSF